VLIPNEVPDESITTSVTVYDEMLTAPIAAGTVLGQVVVSIDGEEQGSINLVNNSEVELSKIEFIKLKLGEFFSKGWVITLVVIVVLLLAVYLILVSRYRALRRRHLQERRRAEEQRRRQRAAREYQRRMEQRRYEEEEDYEPPRRYTRIDAEERRTDPADIDELFNRYRY